MHVADGFAVGAAVATGQVTVQVIVFVAVIDLNREDGRREDDEYIYLFFGIHFFGVIF